MSIPSFLRVFLMSENCRQGLASYCSVTIVQWLSYTVRETLKNVWLVLKFSPYSFIWSFSQHSFNSPSLFCRLQIECYRYTADTLKKFRFVQRGWGVGKFKINQKDYLPDVQHNFRSLRNHIRALINAPKFLHVLKNTLYYENKENSL